jgi:regulatory protein
MSARKLPKPVTRETIEAAALAYLERFATSSANLRRVLMRRVRRSADLHGTDPAEGVAIIEALIERFLANGLLNDRAYAEAKAASLHRRGASARAIAAKLATKGVNRALVENALSETDTETGLAARPGGDLAAAAALARRRRLGPYRLPEARAEYRQKDLATLARTGFSHAVAERVMRCDGPEELEALVRDGE